jgi:hypothetical protein
VLQDQFAAMEVTMKRDHFHTKRPGRPLVLASAVLVVTLSGLMGIRFGLQNEPVPVIADPAAQPTFHESVFQDGRRPSAVPDHALLSASDVERALPVPSRTSSMAASIAS